MNISPKGKISIEEFTKQLSYSLCTILYYDETKMINVHCDATLRSVEGSEFMVFLENRQTFKVKIEEVLGE